MEFMMVLIFVLFVADVSIVLLMKRRNQAIVSQVHSLCGGWQEGLPA